MNGAGTEEQRLPPLAQERHVGRVREDRRVEPVDRRHLHRRHLEDRLDQDPRLEATQDVHHERGIADRAEHQLGLRHRRHDVRGDTARDEADAVVRLAEQRIGRPVDAPQFHQHVDQLVDGRLAQFRKRRVRGAAGGLQHHALDAARGQAEPSIGRFAVDQVSAAAGTRVEGRALGAFASPLLADNEQHADARLALVPQDVGRGDLRGQDPLGVARAAAIDAPVFHTAREERRHAVEVGGKDDGGLLAGRRGEDIEAMVVDLLLVDDEAQLLEAPRQEGCSCPFTASGRVDIDQRAGQPDEVDRAVAHRFHVPVSFVSSLSRSHRTTGRRPARGAAGPSALDGFSPSNRPTADTSVGDRPPRGAPSSPWPTSPAPGSPRRS